ncbi:MAG: tetratricopeptide repeat protein [Alphaproteobacteria bacterium]
MNTRFRLVFSVIVAAYLTGLTPAQAQVMVIGGGMARDCYHAVEYSKIAPSRAMQMCNEALDRESLTNKDRAATLVNRGILSMRQGNYQRAMTDYQQSLELRPELLEAKVNIGAALYGLKRYDEAMLALNEGLKTDSVEARAVGLYNRALIWEQRGDAKAAYYDYREALDLNPTFAQAARQLERFTVTEIGS